MRLVRACLDHRVLDDQGNPLGRIDGLVAGLEDGAPPRLLAVEVGSAALARRLHAGLAHAAMLRRLHLTSWRIEWQRLRQADNDYLIDAAGGEAPSLALERWLARRLAALVPGA